MAHACRCLLAGQLIGLAFDPVAHSEGWCEGVTVVPFPTARLVRSSLPSVISLPLSATLYSSLSCFPHKWLLKTPV